MGYRASGKTSIITFGKILKDEKIFSRMMVMANRSGVKWVRREEKAFQRNSFEQRLENVPSPTVMLNFMCQLEWAMRCQRFGQTLFHVCL